jgi:hypothetical protein
MLPGCFKWSENKNSLNIYLEVCVVVGNFLASRECLLVDHVCHCIHAMPRRSVKNILFVIFLCTNARHIMSLKSMEKLTYLQTLFLRIDCVEFIFKYQSM